jgi:hypothetical protein
MIHDRACLYEEIDIGERFEDSFPYEGFGIVKLDHSIAKVNVD